ncbi:hypothetical protein H2248_008548 [Termitomyces sp. 'cryptogamus']|nr:hypothetical protein H2248_008548 [Termitomyces sp. 'cryptogamus']
MLPDSHKGPIADIYDVFDLPLATESPVLINSKCTTEDPTAVEPTPLQVPVDLVDTPGPVAAEPRCSARLATKMAPPTPLLPNDDPLNPESKDETYVSMPGGMWTMTMASNDTWVPKSYSKAMTQPNLWKASMDEEMKQMHEQKVWCLIECPEGT